MLRCQRIAHRPQVPGGLDFDVHKTPLGEKDLRQPPRSARTRSGNSALSSGRQPETKDLALVHSQVRSPERGPPAHRANGWLAEAIAAEPQSSRLNFA